MIIYLCIFKSWETNRLMQIFTLDSFYLKMVCVNKHFGFPSPVQQKAL